MRLIIAVPFFNTPENRRHFCVKRVLETLRTQAQEPHCIVPVDNGSTDLRCIEWLQHEAGFYPVRIEEPASISQGVNAGWAPWHDELVSGKAIAVKFDSDMIADNGWPEKLLGAITANESEMWNGGVLGMVGLRVQRHPNPPPADAPRGPGEIVKVDFLHGACMARTPIGFNAIGYEKHPFLEEFLPQNADPSLPWGRWGYGDHWTTHRMQYAGFYSGMLLDVLVRGIFGSGSLSRQEKAAIQQAAWKSLNKMVKQLGDNEISPYQPCDVPDGVQYLW
jgi:hypothetical protein